MVRKTLLRVRKNHRLVGLVGLVRKNLLRVRNNILLGPTLGFEKGFLVCKNRPLPANCDLNRVRKPFRNPLSRFETPKEVRMNQKSHLAMMLDLLRMNQGVIPDQRPTRKPWTLTTRKQFLELHPQWPSRIPRATSDV